MSDLSSELASAVGRIGNYLAHLERVGGLDQELVHSLHSIPDAEPGMLLASDLHLLTAEVGQLKLALTEAEVDRLKLEQHAERAESERDDEKAALRRVMVEWSRLRDQADLMHNMLTAVEVGTQTAHGEPVAEFAHAMLQTGAAIALKHVGDSLDADLADINRRAAADKRVLDAAEAWHDWFPYVDSMFVPENGLLYAVRARRALADPEIVITQPVPNDPGPDTPHTVLPDDYPPCPNTREGRPCIFPKHSDEQVCRFLGTEDDDV